MDVARSIPSIGPLPMPSPKTLKATFKPVHKALKLQPKLRYFCKDSAKYLGDIYVSLMRFLLIIRDSPVIFRLLANAVEKNKSLADATCDSIAEDIVFFLLADFTSSENYAINCLSQFKLLIDVPLLLTLVNLQEQTALSLHSRRQRHHLHPPPHQGLS
eukprot:TRINITY_DN20607_c0_g1_i1.p1 TRINITY_DN20607_c0_g1~~TRINITY_DN20607_c0_g1_i1.p1  ORF type:complete len:159 (-),score=23.58 TRINITY_DN20607_c0_g1_i1:667-1143(-)